MDRELISYLPPVLQGIREYRAAAHSETPEIEQAWEACELLYKEPFISEAGNYAIERWEGMLGLHPRASQSLEERRFAVSSRLMESLPYTLSGLRRVLDALCGADGYSLGVSGFVLSVYLSLRVKKHADEIANLMERMLPANILMNLDLMYNRYSALRGLPYSSLSRSTYLGLREETLPAEELI